MGKDRYRQFPVLNGTSREKTFIFRKFRNLKVGICFINSNRGCIFFWVYILLLILMVIFGLYFALIWAKIKRKMAFA